MRVSTPSHTHISTVKLRNVSEAALREHQHTFVKQMLINAFTCGKCLGMPCSKAGHSSAALKTRSSAGNMGLEML